ncbi:PREDICTED: UPF0481 protein At3g47200 isoform X2 [Tarenaya hassleriana]|uniref:UPF0481 protein At3g47200 isoform X2 n=1 Tax=Tarenaya hassleriana TaxID=28532 RepID=UPI00053C8CEE|nr:PREDICTED: UPF0481 protein At3g47200 isoform X2 [Tarenaya hassleriana]
MGEIEEASTSSNVNGGKNKPKLLGKALHLPPSSSAPAGLKTSELTIEYCCVYRVPTRLRRVNPEAYTPQMLLLGPLNHSLKAEAATKRSSSDDPRYLDYLNMESHKRKYLAEFAQRYGGAIVEGFKRKIQEEEKLIRASYAESTEWIESSEFVDMILHDSVFIIEYLLRLGRHNDATKKTDDILINQPFLQTNIWEDFILLENQLPYFILRKMFDPFVETHGDRKKTFRKLILEFFNVESKIKDATEFKHFLDLLRCARVETLPERVPKSDEKDATISHMCTAEKLDSAGDSLEIELRNVMAFEQCHYPYTSYVCNYVSFLDFLIDTEKDVDLLIEKGVIKNWMGYGGSVVDMVNKLVSGVVEENSYYSDIIKSLNDHYKSSYNRSCAMLSRVYFSDLWKGTATVAAAILLILTLIQTVASVIQLFQTGK